MGTRRIVAHITSQAMQVGCLAGAALGAAYGVLLPLGFILITLFLEGLWEPIDTIVMLGLLACFVGLFVGGVIGGIAGLLLGLSNGLAIGLLTIVGYTPMHHPEQYRWSVRLMSVLITLLGCLLVSLVLGRVPGESSDLYFVGLPLLLTLPCGWWAGSRLAHWYLTRLDKTA